MNATEQLEAIGELCDECEVPRFSGSAAVVDRVACLVEQLDKGKRALRKGSDVVAIRKLCLKLGVGRNSDSTLKMVEGLMARLEAAEGQGDE